MFELNQFITVEEFNQIKAKILVECQRRQYQDPLDLFVLEDLPKGTIISAEYFKKILQPLTVLDDFPSSITDLYIAENEQEKRVKLNDLTNVYIITISELENIINRVNQWTDPHQNSSTYSDCRGSCAGLCAGCQGTCDTTCVGGCTNQCSGCSGSCQGSCSDACAGCGARCGGCTSACGAGCGYGCNWTGGNESTYRVSR